MKKIILSTFFIITPIMGMEPEAVTPLKKLPNEIWCKIIACTTGASKNNLFRTNTFLNKLNIRINHHIYMHSPLILAKKDRQFGLLAATHYGNATAVENLLQHGAKLISYSPFIALTPLNIAITQKNNHLIALLKEHNAQPHPDTLPIYAQAVYMGDLPLLNDYLEKKSNLRHYIKYNNYPILHIAIANGHTHIFKRLLEDPQIEKFLNHPHWHLITPLYFAVQEKRYSIITLLLETCPDHTINHQCLNDYSAFHTAVHHKYYDIAQLFLDHPLVKINLCNAARNSPLHTAIYNGDLPMVTLLLSAPKIHPNIKNKNNDNPLDLAKKLLNQTIANRHHSQTLQDIIALLIQKGATTYFYTYKVAPFDNKTKKSNL